MSPFDEGVACVLFRPFGALFRHEFFPTAFAVGCILSPLRGCSSGALPAKRRFLASLGMTKLWETIAALHQYACAHIVDDVPGEFAGLNLGCAGHQALEVVGYFFLLNRSFHALLDQVGGFGPAQVAEHHYA
jgi:hypothetical protein